MFLPECYTFPMTVPSPSHLADVIRKGLTPNFDEVVVEWVDCPNLTQGPFKLAASGLCGNTAILQVGGTGHMFPERKKELTANVLLIENSLHSICGSRMTYSIARQRRTSEILTLRDHECAMMGNFYISEGKPGIVLKVYAKRRTGNVEFINAMQSALASHFPATYLSDQCVGLGGVFLASQGSMRHHIIPLSWAGIKSQDDLRSSLQYFNIEAPLIGVGTFLNTDRHIATHVDGRPCIKPVALTTKQFHTFGLDGEGGFYERDLNPNVVEYLGYFFPAEIMYRVAPSVNPEIPNLYV